MAEKSTYLSLGVSATKDEVHSAIKSQDAGAFKHSFCKLVEDGFDSDYCVAMHADGAGTKSSLAYIMYKETGDLGVFSDIAQDSVVMNLDDLLCVGAYDGMLLSNTIGRNAHRINGEVIKHVIKGYSSFTDKLRTNGIGITMVGGETADVGDLVQTMIVDSTFYARIPKKKVVTCATIKPGDVIVGLASFGQAAYEDKYNSGIGSNGLTAARHLIFDHIYADKYPESYASSIDKNIVYTGKSKLTDPLEGTPLTVGQAVLSPTRTYAPIVGKLLREHFDSIHGMIHNTGGGLAKCKGFGEGLHFIKDNLFDTPPIFKLIGSNGGIGEREMYQVFNMGQRFEIYCDEDFSDTIIETAKSFGVDAQIIGHVEASDSEKNRVTVCDNGRTFEY